MSVDLLAESQARENLAACLAAALPVRTAYPADTPHGLDAIVFGGFAPCREPVPHHGLYRICPAHPGLSWYGTGDCWVCKPGPV